MAPSPFLDVISWSVCLMGDEWWGRKSHKEWKWKNPESAWNESYHRGVVWSGPHEMTWNDTDESISSSDLPYRMTFCGEMRHPAESTGRTHNWEGLGRTLAGLVTLQSNERFHWIPSRIHQLCRQRLNTQIRVRNDKFGRRAEDRRQQRRAAVTIFHGP